MRQSEHDGDLSNEVFAVYANGCEKTPSRIKGLYACPFVGGCGVMFVKAVARKTAACPYCGKNCEKIKDMTVADMDVFKWSMSLAEDDERLDRKFIGKEIAV